MRSDTVLNDLGDLLGERDLACLSQHVFERHPGGSGNRASTDFPAPQIAVAGDQQGSGQRRQRQPERLAAAHEGTDSDGGAVLLSDGAGFVARLFEITNTGPDCPVRRSPLLGATR